MSWSIQRLAEARDRRPLHRFGTMLFDQQMWCWGRDVVRTAGNLLCAYGFDRYRRDSRQSPGGHICIDGNPKQKVFDSGYFMVHDGGPWIGLWGWGMVYGTSHNGGLFLRRFGFDPAWLDVTVFPLHLLGPEDLTSLRGGKDDDPWPQLRHLFPAALHWIARYERWVHDVAGLAYREACVDQWFKERFPARDMATAWDLLADRVLTVYFKRFARSD